MIGGIIKRMRQKCYPLNIFLNFRGFLFIQHYIKLAFHTISGSLFIINPLFDAA